MAWKKKFPQLASVIAPEADEPSLPQLPSPPKAPAPPQDKDLKRKALMNIAKGHKGF